MKTFALTILSLLISLPIHAEQPYGANPYQPGAGGYPQSGLYGVPNGSWPGLNYGVVPAVPLACSEHHQVSEAQISTMKNAAMIEFLKELVFGSDRKSLIEAAGTGELRFLAKDASEERVYTTVSDGKCYRHTLMTKVHFKYALKSETCEVTAKVSFDPAGKISMNVEGYIHKCSSDETGMVTDIKTNEKLRQIRYHAPVAPKTGMGRS